MLTTIENIVFIALKGTVLALDRSNGRELWRTPLKGSDFVNLTFDQPDLFATTKGEIFCLDAQTGSIRWNNPLKGMGWGLITIATASGDDNLPAAVQQRRVQQQQAAAASTASAHAG